MMMSIRFHIKLVVNFRLICGRIMDKVKNREVMITVKIIEKKQIRKQHRKVLYIGKFLD